MPDVVINGKTYEVSDDALAQMAKDGVKYEPVAAESGGFMQGVGDTARGAAHGVSMGLADAKFGDANQSLMQRLGMDDYEKVKGRSPVLTTVGDIGGSILNPAGEIGAAARGAGAIARIGAGAASAGVEGLVRSAADQGQGFDMSKALEQGGWSGLLGAALPALGGGVSALAKTKGAAAAAEGLGDMAKRSGDTSRLKAFGIGNQELQDLAKKTGTSGDQLASDTAAHLESLVPSPKWGSSASDKAVELEKLRKAAGQEIGDSLNLAGAPGPLGEGLSAKVPGAWQQLQDRLETEALSLPATSPAENALSSSAMGAADRLRKEAAPAELGDLHQRVSKWGREAYGADKTNKAVTTPENSASARTAEMLRDNGRDELQGIIDQASQGTQDKFNSGMDNFRKVMDYERAAAKRGTTEAARSDVMGTVAAPIVGAASGGLTGLVSGGLPGMVSGAGLGFGMSLNSGTRNAFRQAAETSRGFDIAANAARHIEPQLRNANKLVDGLGEALSKQGTRPGVSGVEGMAIDQTPDLNFEEQERRRALGYGSR